MMPNLRGIGTARIGTVGRGMSGSLELLTCGEAAERLRVSLKTIYRLVAVGRIPALHLGRTIRIPVIGLEELIADAARGHDPGSHSVTTELSDDGDR